MSSAVLEVKSALLKGDIYKVAELMRLGWFLKKSTSSLIMPSNIKQLIDLTVNLGAMACKLSGAGGGGYMLLLANSEDAFLIKKNLPLSGEKQSLYVLLMKVQTHGKVRTQFACKN